MGLVKGLFQFVDGIMRVHLCGGKTAVTEEVFNGVDLGAFIQQVRSIGVS
jgi:hypothetical protein